MEQRLRISTSRYRVLDLCLVVGAEPVEQVFTQPPALCIEVLSKDDRLRDMQERLRDYFAVGVREVWIVDPKRKALWRCTDGSAEEGSRPEIPVPTSSFTLPLAEIWDDFEH